MASAIVANDSGGRAGSLYRRGNEWFCSTSLQSDIAIEVEGTLFHLHKFPLISKCGKIARMVKGSHDAKDDGHTLLEGCPGGSDGFLIAARFCYASKAELKPENILMAYLVADFLEMTADYSEDNLLMQAESFIHKVILRSWNDCISALQNCIIEAENLPIVRKCLNAVSLMASRDPSSVGKPTIYGSLQSPDGSILWNGINTGARINSAVSDWWFEDVSSLSFPIFKKIIETINARGIKSLNVTGALIFYATKHLPGLDRWQNRQGGRRIGRLYNDSAAVDQKFLIKSIVEFLPENKEKSYCRFLLRLLRFAIMLDVDGSCKESLERKIGMHLGLVTLDGLLIPTFSGSDHLYDTDCVERIIRHFLSHHHIQSLKISPFSASSSYHVIPRPSGILHKAAKLIDDYLAEVASDENLKPQKMRSLLEVFPEYLRKLDDGIYRALDIYFKEHPWLQENEREKLCQAISFRRLSAAASVHASQNESLPLRAALQVLFFEQQQLRSTLSRLNLVADYERNAVPNADETQSEGWVSVARENQGLRVDMERIQSKVRELETQFMVMKKDVGRFSRRSISR